MEKKTSCHGVECARFQNKCSHLKREHKVLKSSANEVQIDLLTHLLQPQISTTEMKKHPNFQYILPCLVVVLFFFLKNICFKIEQQIWCKKLDTWTREALNLHEQLKVWFYWLNFTNWHVNKQQKILLVDNFHSLYFITYEWCTV